MVLKANSKCYRYYEHKKNAVPFFESVDDDIYIQKSIYLSPVLSYLVWEYKNNIGKIYFINLHNNIHLRMYRKKQKTSPIRKNKRNIK